MKSCHALEKHKEQQAVKMWLHMCKITGYQPLLLHMFLQGKSSKACNNPSLNLSFLLPKVLVPASDAGLGHDKTLERLKIHVSPQLLNSLGPETASNILYRTREKLDIKKPFQTGAVWLRLSMAWISFLRGPTATSPISFSWLMVRETS
jgi:hypothetical protein